MNIIILDNMPFDKTKKLPARLSKALTRTLIKTLRLLVDTMVDSAARFRLAHGRFHWFIMRLCAFLQVFRLKPACLASDTVKLVANNLS